MTTYAGLLRAINVGGHRRVPMDELRRLLGGLGWSGVRTYLQSGNAIFTTEDPDPRPRLERALAEHFGFEIRCLVRTARELRQIAEVCPYPAAELDPAKLLVFLLDEPPEPGHFDAIDPAAYAPDTFQHIGQAVYCYFPEGVGHSKLPSALAEARPPLTMTGRNWRTVQRLVELAS